MIKIGYFCLVNHFIDYSIKTRARNTVIFMEFNGKNYQYFNSVKFLNLIFSNT